MIRLILTLWYISLLRYGPQVLPNTRSGMQQAVFLHIVIGTLYNMVYVEWPRAVQYELASLVVTFLFVRLALMLSQRNERFNKTLVAMLGSDAVISAVGLLLVTLLVRGLQLEELWSATHLLLVAWGFVVSAHIFRHSFSTNFAIGLLIAFAFFYSSFMIMALVLSSLN